jgi:hypothetical protein
VETRTVARVGTLVRHGSDPWVSLPPGVLWKPPLGGQTALNRTLAAQPSDGGYSTLRDLASRGHQQFSFEPISNPVHRASFRSHPESVVGERGHGRVLPTTGGSAFESRRLATNLNFANEGGSVVHRPSASKLRQVTHLASFKSRRATSKQILSPGRSSRY